MDQDGVLQEGDTLTEPALYGGPGRLDQFALDQFASPFMDQKARILRALPFTLTDAAPSITLPMGDVPCYWLVCLQAFITTAGNVLTITVQQAQSEAVVFKAANSAAAIYGSVYRLIVRGHERHITITKAYDVGTTGTTVVGTVFAVGAGVDPSKVGLF